MRWRTLESWNQCAVRPRVLVFESGAGEGAGSMDAFCGIDWVEGHHDIALVDDTGKLLAKCRINEDLDGHRLLLAEHGDTAETGRPWRWWQCTGGWPRSAGGAAVRSRSGAWRGGRPTGGR